MKPHVLGNKGWKTALVSKRLDERSYEIAAEDENIYRQNRIHLKPTNEPPPSFDMRFTKHDNNKPEPMVRREDRPVQLAVLDTRAMEGKAMDILTRGDVTVGTPGRTPIRAPTPKPGDGEVHRSARVLKAPPHLRLSM